MRSTIITIILVSGLFIFFQGKSLTQYKEQYSDSDVSGTQAVEQISEYLSSYTSFAQVFGIVEDDATNNNGTATANTADRSNNKPPPEDIDKPPPTETWLLDPETRTKSMVIPPTINKIYFQKGSGFPSLDSMTPNLKKAHESWKIFNPGYTIRYFDLDQARKYLHQHFHPVFLRAFDCLPAFAAKSDLFRMTLLYREGGWHSDWKQRCLQKDALKNITEVTDFFATYDLWSSNDYFPHKCVQNAFVGSRPQHPIIETMLRMILINIQSNHYAKSALDATSTCILGRAIVVSEKERNSTWFETIAGKHVTGAENYHGAYQFNGQNIAQHKCEDCGGGGQDWGATGNNYLELYKQRNFYCQDSESLFRTTYDW